MMIFKNKYKILLLGFVFAACFTGGVFAAEDEILAPSITIAPANYYPLEEILYIEGTAHPKVSVEIFFEKSGSSPLKVTAQSNSRGEWYYSGKLELAEGQWSVRARAVTADYESDWSNPRLIRSVVNGLVWGKYTVMYLTIVIILICFSVVLFILFIYSFLKLKKIKQKILREDILQSAQGLKDALAKEKRHTAEIIMEHDFTELHRKITKEIEALEKQAKKGKPLSREDEGARQRLMDDLREIEERLGDQIKDLL